MFYLDILYLLLHRDSPCKVYLREMFHFCLQAVLHLGHKIKSVTVLLQNNLLQQICVLFPTSPNNQYFKNLKTYF